MSGNMVKLNIGGTRFTTTRDTLLSYRDSFFTALLTGEIPSTRDEEGAYFIDREGRYFEPILNYLRTGQIHIPRDVPRAAVAEEADFYSLAHLVQEMRRRADPCGGVFFNELLMRPVGASPTAAVRHLLAQENRLVVALEDGLVTSHVWDAEHGWVREFTSTHHRALGGAPERMAFFSASNIRGRWFLASYARGSIYVWQKDQQIGTVSLGDDAVVDTMYFMRRGQNLVALNKRAGRAYIVSLATVSLRTIHTERSISCSCFDSDNVTSYCCSGGAVYQLMIGHDENLCFQLVYRDPLGEEITSICTREQRTIFYGTCTGVIRRLDFSLSEFGGLCQSTLLVSGHIHPIDAMLPLGNRTLASMCVAGHIRCFNNSDVHMMSSYSSPPGARLCDPYLLRQVDDRVEVVNILNGEILEAVVSVTGARVSAYCVCSDTSFYGGSLLVSGHTDGSVQVWSLGLLSLILRRSRASSSAPPVSPPSTVTPSPFAGSSAHSPPSSSYFFSNEDAIRQVS